MPEETEVNVNVVVPEVEAELPVAAEIESEVEEETRTRADDIFDKVEICERELATQTAALVSLQSSQTSKQEVQALTAEVTSLREELRTLRQELRDRNLSPGSPLSPPAISNPEAVAVVINPAEEEGLPEVPKPKKYRRI